MWKLVAALAAALLPVSATEAGSTSVEVVLGTPLGVERVDPTLAAETVMLPQYLPPPGERLRGVDITFEGFWHTVVGQPAGSPCGVEVLPCSRVTVESPGTSFEYPLEGPNIFLCGEYEEEIFTHFAASGAVPDASIGLYRGNGLVGVTLTHVGCTSGGLSAYSNLSFTGDESAQTNAFVRITYQTSPACLGDANLDGMVTFNDITIVLAQLGATQEGFDELPGDADFSGAVNFNDITTVLASIGRTDCE